MRLQNTRLIKSYTDLFRRIYPCVAFGNLGDQLWGLKLVHKARPVLLNIVVAWKDTVRQCNFVAESIFGTRRGGFTT